MIAVSPKRSVSDAWLPKTPKDWCRTKLGFVASIKARLGWKGLKAEEYVDDGYVFLSTPNIKDRMIDFYNVNYISEARYLESPEIVLEPGDVLIAKEGSTLGITNVVRHLPRPATVNGSIAVVRPGPEVHSVFLYYYFQSNVVQSVIQLMKSGMGVPHLFQADMRKFDILLPSIEEQARIADFLDRKIAAVDEVIQGKERMLALVEEHWQVQLKDVVTSGLNNTQARIEHACWPGISFPANWEPKKLKYVVPEVTVGIVVTPAKYYVDDGVPCLRSLNVVPNEIRAEDLVYISEDSNAILGKSQLRDGDVVVVRTGKPGTAAVVDNKWAGCNCIDLIIVRRSNLLNSEFLARFMNSRVANAEFAARSAGAIQSHFNIEMAKELIVPVPPRNEQEAIVENLRQKVVVKQKITDSLASQCQALYSYRQALITAAVTGTIDIPGTSDQKRTVNG